MIANTHSYHELRASGQSPVTGPAETSPDQEQRQPTDDGQAQRGRATHHGKRRVVAWEVEVEREGWTPHPSSWWLRDPPSGRMLRSPPIDESRGQPARRHAPADSRQSPQGAFDVGLFLQLVTGVGLAPHLRRHRPARRPVPCSSGFAFLGADARVDHPDRSHQS